MALIGVIEIRQDFLELHQNVVVASHVCGQNTSNDAFSNFPECLFAEVLKNITVWVLQKPEGNRAVMILQR